MRWPAISPLRHLCFLSAPAIKNAAKASWRVSHEHFKLSRRGFSVNGLLRSGDSVLFCRINHAPQSGAATAFDPSLIRLRSAQNAFGPRSRADDTVDGHHQAYRISVSVEHPVSANPWWPKSWTADWSQIARRKVAPANDELYANSLVRIAGDQAGHGDGEQLSADGAKAGAACAGELLVECLPRGMGVPASEIYRIEGAHFLSQGQPEAGFGGLRRESPRL